MSNFHAWRWFLGLAFVAGAVGLVTAASPELTAAPAAAEVCSWTTIDRQSSGNFHVASAFDNVNNKAYLYGGVDQSGRENQFLGELDLSDPDLSNASFRSIRQTPGLTSVYGSAGFFRPDSEDPDRSAAYFVGGSRNAAVGEGNGNNFLFRYTPSAGTIEQVNSSLPNLLLAAVAYDPDGDRAIIYGGTNKCSPNPDADAANNADQCRGSTQIGTRMISFDAMTGAPTVSSVSAGNAPGQVFGATMVYDPEGKRMLLFGGTTDGSRANGDVYALPLDPAVGSWTRIAVSGGPRARFLHSAAFDSSRKWMVLTGGVASGFYGNENTFQDTWALDLSDPTMLAWHDLSTAPLSVRDRVAATMFYADNHMSTVVHGGRTQLRGTGSPRPTGNSDALSCMEAPPTPTMGPTNTPAPTRTPGPGSGSTNPWEPPAANPGACDQLQGRVPDAAINAALGNPPRAFALCNPNVPISPVNLYRDKLGLLDRNKPYNPIFNPLIWKCGCP